MGLTEKDCDRLRAILQGKALGYRYSEIAGWLASADFRPPRPKPGDHRTWRHPSGRRVVLVDRGHGELLPAYPKNAIKIIFETGACV